MDKFFAPKSVAAIGASATPGKPGNVLLHNIRDNEFKGPVYPVNPRGGTIEDLPVYARLADVPVDLARISVYLHPEQTMSLLSEMAEKDAGEVWFNPGSADEAVPGASGAPVASAAVPGP